MSKLKEAKWRVQLLLPYSDVEPVAGVSVWSRLFDLVLTFLLRVEEVDPTLYRFGQLPQTGITDKFVQKYGACVVLALVRLGREKWVVLREQVSNQHGPLELVRVTWPESWVLDSPEYRARYGEEYYPPTHAVGFRFKVGDNLRQECAEHGKTSSLEE